jgi:hypothetical protein
MWQPTQPLSLSILSRHRQDPPRSAPRHPHPDQFLMSAKSWLSGNTDHLDWVPDCDFVREWNAELCHQIQRLWDVQKLSVAFWEDGLAPWWKSFHGNGSMKVLSIEGSKEIYQYFSNLFGRPPNFWGQNSLNLPYRQIGSFHWFESMLFPWFSKFSGSSHTAQVGGW